MDQYAVSNTQHVAPALGEARSNPQQRLTRLAVAALIIAILGLGTGLVSQYEARSNHDSTARQIAHLQRELDATQGTLAKVRAGDAKSATNLSGLATQVSDLSTSVSGLAAYNTICTQALTTSAGAAQFDYPCTLHRGR